MEKRLTVVLLILLQFLCSCKGSQRKEQTFRFTHIVYNTTIYENSAAKTYLESRVKMGIYITDAALEIRYKIISGDTENLFKAEEYILGNFCFLRIRTKGGSSAVLNREVKDHYMLTVKALERGTSAEARARVKVQVLDTNDLRPLFSPTSYSIYLPENTAVRSSVARVTATDADIGTNGEYYYSFRDWTDVFAIHPTSGIVTLMSKLDYSETRLYEMDVLAVDRGTKLYGSHGFSSMAKLTVRVEQANEHAPVITAVTLKPTQIGRDPTYAIVMVDDGDQGANGEIASLSIVAGDPLLQFKTVRTSPGSKEYKIKAVNGVDWDSQPYGCNLTLQAKDKGNPPQFSAVKVVHVMSPQLKVAPPKFEKSLYQVKLSEFVPLHAPVVVVRVVPKYPQLKYILKHKTENNRFTLNQDTGLITTAGQLQAEETSKFELEVTTSDGSATTKVVISVTDVNNNAPEFLQTSYKVSIDEHVPIGTEVLTVSASDADGGENGFITYSIATGNPQPFRIDYFTGVISTAGDLDYELMPRIYNLRVRASDWGSPFRREAEASVVVTLNNLNDNKPLFENVDCKVTVPRDFGVNRQIATVSAIDADELQLVRYEIKSGNDRRLFDLNPNSGMLSLQWPLGDGEGAQHNFYSLQITASDGEYTTPPMIMNITVNASGAPVHLKCVDTGVAKMLAKKLLQGANIHSHIEPENSFIDIHSVNRHAPQLMDTFPTVIDIKEDLPVGARVALIDATDPDSGFNGKLVFVISGGDTESRFVIEMDTGWLKVYAPLDRETTSHYTLNITVYDLGIPQKSISRLLDVNIIDSNDNSPEFLQESYSVVISEDTAVGSDVIQIEATDKDLGVNGKVRYSLVTNTDMFSINKETGVVKVKSPLDREVYPVLVLKVEARDQATNDPQLISGVSLKVTLEDVNDNPPRFFPPNYRTRVREDLPVGTVVMWLEAHDPDTGNSGQVRYSLAVSGDGDFVVDKQSGAVRIAQNLDYEKMQVYNLTARAKDKGKPVSLSSTCYIELEIVDVNENLYRPWFPSFAIMGSVKEDAIIGTSVMKVTAVDEDKGRDGEIRYSIRDGSGLGIFTIDKESGVIRTEELLDHETTPHYWLTIYATDQGVVPLSSFIEVFIEVEDINDNAPQTSEPVYYPSVMENSPKDVSVIHIEAFDPDTRSSDKLSYKITSGNPQGFFAINPKTGLVTTTSRRLDREQQEEHILEITVTDHGVPPKLAVVRVIVEVQDENDNKPQFLEKIYKIKLPERDEGEGERTAGSATVYRVIASDRDKGPNAEISYSVAEGDEHGKFFIESKTGLVSSKKLSFAGEYDILTIKAVDNGRPQKSATCRLHIEWIPKPMASSKPLSFDESSFSFSVMESDPVSHMVGVITTEPTDTPVWFDITGDTQVKEMFHIVQMDCDLNCTAEGGNFDSRFDVNKGSGTIIVARPLDAEQKSNYNLTVEATDGTNSISTQVSIRVIDTNNHRPQFSRHKYEINIPEDTAPETEILQISASDEDEKNKMSYTLLSSTDPFSLKKFRLDPGTGLLYTAESLDHETMRRHTLTVMVRDQDIPVKRNLARVIISVGDANDNAPRFTSTLYEARVLESATPGSAVLQVSALDKDKGRNAEILYSIESGNVADSFAVDPVLGTVTVAKELEGSSEFELSVKALDKGLPPLSTLTTVHITVTVSDNAKPKFAEREFSAEISETAPVGSFVSAVTASSQSSIFYQIKDGNVNGAFDINPSSGVVVTRRSLDYETLPLYRLTVHGSNMAGMANNVTLLVRLRDENDNAPIFTQADFAGTVSESAPVNSVVLTQGQSPLVIRASDADSDLNARLVYQIIEQFAHRYFAIDSSTGAIWTAGSLDYEQRNSFQFTVQVHDLGTPRLFADAAANVTVQVVDINDCPPQFSQDLYETSIMVPTYKGVKVIEVNATDADNGGNSKLLFSISNGNLGDNFQMDPISGAVFVENATLLRSRYELAVRVSDGRFVSTASVCINVLENKNSTLKFTQDLYTAFVLENSSEKRTLAVVAILGSPINEPLFYAILNPDKRFRIGRTSGVLSATGVPFDREEKDKFDVVVEVTKEERSSGFAHVLVKVIVEDKNDNVPVFVNLPYLVSLVQRQAAVGHIIKQVTAVDGDAGRNGEIRYSLSDDHEYFKINPSGEISLKKNFEEGMPSSEFVINIVAKDGGEIPLSSTVELRITIVEKAVPVFEKPFYSIEIPENVQLHAAVLHVQASGSEGPRVGYSIAEGDPFRQFSIDFNTGVLHVLRPLDYETHPAYKLRVRATDLLTGAHAKVFVDIILEDVNDNPPVFEAKTYTVILSEASVIGTSVLQLTATDSDSSSNRALFYQLVEDGSQSFDCFSIDPDSGIIWTACALDREEMTQHKLAVRAVDRGVPALMSDVAVLIEVADLNDNAPAFSQRTYEASVSEFAPHGHFVTCVQASDADSSDVAELEYSLLSGNEDQSFAIDRKSGQITISKHRKEQMQPLYTLNVSVSDGVFWASAAVRLRVISANSHSPTFSLTNYVVELSESSPIGTLVTEVEATDEDAGTYGRVTYYIVNGFAKERFSINEGGQIFTVERVDREKPFEKFIPISLMAKDGGGKVTFCTVTVVLTDVNDNAPQFQAAEYRVSMSSDVPRGTTVVKITATDMDEGTNADITYSIEADDDNVEENFEIHPFNGMIVTKESLLILENDMCAFYVRAKDAGNPPRYSVVPVSVKVLPSEVPMLKFAEPHYRFTVTEDLPIGSEIGVIQAESEHPVVYNHVKGNTPESNQDEVFVIDRDTGRLKLEKELDYETTKWYQLTLLAQITYDGDDVVTAVDINIQIKDSNDNSPLFDSDPYEAFVTENLPQGTLVIPVKAVDLDAGDNGRVFYGLDENQETEDITKLFTIDSETGWITTLRELDREKWAKYAVRVVASDQGEKEQLAASAIVQVTVVDVNDSPPRFTAELYQGTVSEDDPLPSGVVAILSTTDADSEETNKQVSYYITGGDPLGQFGIEHVQKDWKVSVRKPLDREKRDNYLLNITATDGTFVAKATVEVKVLDANDNSPVCGKTLYAESVPEDTPPGKLILKVSATDADIRSNAEISYQLLGPGSDMFSIDSHTGELRTLLPLDWEERGVYDLQVRALDGGGRYCEAHVRIAVEDVNDNAPQFASEIFPITVFENTEIHTFVAQLQASDADFGSNSDVLYSFVDSADGQFSIDEESGIISLEKPLDRLVQAVFRLQARALDQGAPRRLSSVCTVLVSVLDINDSPPAFERREYAATVPEDVAVGSQVLRVSATSKDGVSPAEVSYSVVSGNERGTFSIDSHTGDIFVIESLDYESTQEYYLTVEAVDRGSPSLRDTATVSINVTDINDNSPAFSQTAYTAVVSEDSDPGKTVVTVLAQDPDGPSGNHVRYSIIGGNQDSPFTIDAVEGEVKVARQLDREKISGYTLTVLALDNGNPPKSSSAKININVSDVNDNPPAFSQANYSLVVQENRPEGTVVLQLAVTDRDAPHNGPPFSFTIVRGNEGNAFRINQEGAVLTTTKLDWKTTELYTLQMEVADSGKPPLASSAFVSVRVVRESVHPPAVLPLDVFVTTQGEGYAGGVLGKIHATDQDVYDTLTYGLPPEYRGPFSVSAADGKLVARGPLDEGRYTLNVTVTDGRFAAEAPVSVHVRQVTPRALNGSVAVRFAGVSPEEFVGDHWRHFLRALRAVAGLRRADVVVASLQPVGRGAGEGLDVLLALPAGPSLSGGAVFRKLNASADTMEEMTGARIVRVVDKVCAGLDCPRGFCDEVIALDQGAMVTHSTARLSFVTPRHHRTSVCLCKGGKCPVLSTLCEGHPCPEGSVCIANQKEASYTCVCPDGKPGKCSAGPSLTFGGSGYVKYRLMENDNKEELKLSLRLRTFSSHATLMYARGTDYSILEVQNGRLQYRFDCGSGPGLVSVHSIQVNDGEWHVASLEVNGNYAKLVLDKHHTASGTAPGALRTLNLDDVIFFGGYARQHAVRHAGRHSRSPPAAAGFRGCMQALVLNGQELPLSAKGHARTILEDMVGASPGCTMAPPPGCSKNTCTNGGTCSSLPNGGYFCTCGALFMGSRCEIVKSPCASNPCLYGGTCVPRSGGFYCQCRGQYSGQRCQLGPYCKDQPCKNSGKCIESLDGPVCECERGFHGDRCLSDVDECLKNPCTNGGRCENTYGSYSCNCSLGFSGQLCELRADIRNQFISTSWNIGMEEVVGIVVFVLSIFILALLFVLVRKGCSRPKKPKPEEDATRGLGSSFLRGPYLDPKLSRNIYSDVPPRVPVRPISYTPSVPGDSRNNLDRSSFEGSVIPEHPEFSTFSLDSAHLHRKAVCSVAPNLPPPPPSIPASDSDSIQKPAWDYEYDAELVELDPCLKKKPSKGNTSQRVSDVHSVGFFHSEAYDDHGYHWDTSDWMPNVHLPGIQEFPQYGSVGSPAPLYSDPNILDTDYYPGGYDIESDILPPPKDFPIHNDSTPVLELGDQYGAVQPPSDMPPQASPGSFPHSQRLYSLHRYLPQHQYPTDLPQTRDPAPGPKDTGLASSLAL